YWFVCCFVAIVCVFVFFFFFFQAEDGIRDRTVTGVQTCALPICGAEPLDSEGCDLDSSERDLAEFPQSGLISALAAVPIQLGSRSEERRVGKECRCRWGAGE